MDFSPRVRRVVRPLPHETNIDVEDVIRVGDDAQFSSNSGNEVSNQAPVEGTSDVSAVPT